MSRKSSTRQVRPESLDRVAQLADDGGVGVIETPKDSTNWLDGALKSNPMCGTSEHDPDAPRYALRAPLSFEGAVVARLVTRRARGFVIRIAKPPSDPLASPATPEHNLRPRPQ